MNKAVFTNIFVHYTCTGKNTMRGLTIIEMIAGLAVIAFVSVVAIPAFIAQLSGYNIDRSAKKISSSFTIARLSAIESRMPHRVKFDLNSTPQKFTVQRGVTSLGVTTWVKDVNVKEMKDDIIIGKVDDFKEEGRSCGIGSIEFSPTGHPTKGAVYLAAKTERYTIALDIATGRTTKTKGW